MAPVVSCSRTIDFQVSLRAVGLESDEGINCEPLIAFQMTSHGCCYR